MKKSLLFVLIALLGMPMAAMAAGITGDCADCHTMHNSEQGQPVALSGFSTVGSQEANQNLLRMDCIACHARGGSNKIAEEPGGSFIPQVYHEDTTGDLAAGNFKYIADSNRRGHNVIDLIDAGLFTADTNSASNTYARPPGFTPITQHQNNDPFGEDFSNFTCAGAAGCHGTRNSLVEENGPERTGIAALSGAHHNSYDGLKKPGQARSGHFGEDIANSYRFIDGLWGYGNEAVGGRWQNLTDTSHNEYFGSTTSLQYQSEDDVTNAISTDCSKCHVNGGARDHTTTMAVPNQSMSGFCTTCHGDFHSSDENGVSGAFLRHPSDFVIPNSGEYANYGTYDTSAPVARPAAFFTDAMTASGTVTPSTDMVMCLSCHVAHASNYDGMLRFDYTTMTAGHYDSVAAAQAEGGCLACHTTKGVLLENR